MKTITKVLIWLIAFVAACWIAFVIVVLTNENTIKEYSVKSRVEALKKEMASTLDVNKKIEIAKKIENIKKEVLKW